MGVFGCFQQKYTKNNGRIWWLTDLVFTAISCIKQAISCIKQPILCMKYPKNHVKMVKKQQKTPYFLVIFDHFQTLFQGLFLTHTLQYIGKTPYKCLYNMYTCKQTSKNSGQKQWSKIIKNHLKNHLKITYFLTHIYGVCLQVYVLYRHLYGVLPMYCNVCVKNNP